MGRDLRTLRGDANAVLNGFVRAGVIIEFQTNLGTPSSALAPHVYVAAPVITDLRQPGYDRDRVEGLRARIAQELGRIGLNHVVVSIRNAQM